MAPVRDSKEVEFQRELEVFRVETETAIQYFYARQAFHLVAAADSRVVAALNLAPRFWNTSTSALQLSAMITLGRIFDPDPKNHSVSRLLSLAQKNLHIFSKAAISARKRAESVNADEFLEEYLKTVYEPEPRDIQRLKDLVAVRRKTYESNYRGVRHQVFAHRSVADRGEIDALFAKTNIGELQKLLTFLARLHEVLWQLLYNGRRPVFRPERYSTKHILSRPSPTHKQPNTQERIAREAQLVLKSLVREI
ncbi:hypothetical protein [Polaromonas sp. YR568]|uniref:AbiU2 domain-containing protein n=1 Tax=Polaromonas sp. YR568 TaxID=1855301 RepID=UPI003137A768